MRWAVRAGVMTAVALELILLGRWAAGSDPRLLAIIQVVLALLVGIGAVALRYGWLRSRYRTERETSLVLDERARLAEQMHDRLGHDLSLLALMASRLQVEGPPETAERAAALRLGAARATDRLHEIVDVLGPVHGSRPPVRESVQDLVDQGRAAGQDIIASTDPWDRLETAVELTTIGIVREALGNAARHAPDHPVTLSIRLLDSEVTVRVRNQTGFTDGRQGSGLAAWHRRALLLGGSLTAGRVDDVWELVATLPRRPTVTDPITRHASDATAISRPWRQLVRDIAIPVAVVLVGSTAYWQWAQHDAQLSSSAFETISVGQGADRAAQVLPPRDAVLQLGVPAAPPGATCRVVTDGNFPLALASFRICVTDDRVVTTEDLR